MESWRKLTNYCNLKRNKKHHLQNMESQQQDYQEIKNALSAFQETKEFALFHASQKLFEVLGFSLFSEEENFDLPFLLFTLDETAFIDRTHRKLLANHSITANLVGFLTTDSLNHRSKEAFNLETLAQKKYASGLLVFSLELPFEPKKADLIALTRMFNRNYEQTPAILVFRYPKTTFDNSQRTFISVTTALRKDRQKKSQYEGEVIQKVSMIRDIDVQNPHRGHLQIIDDMRADKHGKKLTSFEDLYTQWRNVFDLNLLNKKFYQEISNWFFCAVHFTKFPIVEDKTQEQTNQIAVIRLLTRFMFVWFIKEKGLVPSYFFDEKGLKKILQNFEPQPNEGLFANPKNATTYYKAILQNLFFATLNQPKTDNDGKKIERKFAEDKGFYRNRAKDNDVKSLYRYENLFRDKDTQKIIQWFDTVPFLNGGLFDCLDRGKAYYDGFTRRPKYQAQVPDFLFFATDINSFSDKLQKIYGVKKQKYHVRGLIQILNDYKFTIEENTPINQDVALDPELLGQVFENLLAYYNPETATTARKSTGSFYTPREIVDYMVEESLINYLKTKIIDFAKSKKESQKTEADLRKLLDIQQTRNPFEDKPQETQFLVQAIYELKVIDPACGSGAFPMGVLLKLLSVLQKLDSDNQYSKKVILSQQDQEKERLIQQLRKQLDTELKNKLAEIKKNKAVIEQITFEELREENRTSLNQREEELLRQHQQNIQEIEANFSPEKHEIDYGKKLYLIQNCIYGVDIQSIAIQISKLRFFLSLVIEQKNEHIQPLPNLETKFITANTLIGLKQQNQMAIQNLEIEALRKKMELDRATHFTIKDKGEKLRLQKYAQKDRQTLQRLLRKDGWDNENAQKIAQFDIFDQNATADWYDSKWMFGIEKGFDLVIGNPPYISIAKMESKKTLKAQKFQTFANTGDIYSLFYEKGNQLLKQKGILCYITSRQWMHANYGKNTRKYFAQKTNPLILLDFAKVKIFENATVFVNILVSQNFDNQEQLQACALKGEKLPTEPLRTYFETNSFTLNQLGEQTWNVTDKLTQKVNLQIEEKGTILKNWKGIQFYAGIKTGYNKAFHITKDIKNQLIAKDSKSKEVIKPLLRGKDIKRWNYQYKNWYTLFIPWHFPLHNNPSITGSSHEAEKDFQKLYPVVYNYFLTYKEPLSNRNKAETGIRYEWYALQRYGADFWQNYEKPKIVWIEISDKANYAYDDSGMYLTNSAYFLSGKNLKYLLALLNSKVADFYFSQITAKIAGGRKRYTKQYVEQIPIPQISKTAQKPFEILVDYILWLKEHPNLLVAATDQAMSDYFEQILDGGVYELYFSESFHQAENRILAYLAEIPPILASDNEKVVLAFVRQIYQKYHATQHPLRKSLHDLVKIPEVQIILGKNIQ